MKRPDKLTPIYLGPYEVISHYKNDITCKHLHRNERVVIHMDEVKPFFGTRKETEQAALNDRNQYMIDSIIEWKGDPLLRTSLQFRIQWSDDTWIGIHCVPATFE